MFLIFSDRLRQEFEYIHVYPGEDVESRLKNAERYFNRSGYRWIGTGKNMDDVSKLVNKSKGIRE